MMFNQYPYINVNDLNLDYILKQIKVMMEQVTNFVSINAIKYADPIQWDITRQYEKNTVVIDPVTGTAYITVAPVPAGVALTRPEYWTVVFDLGSFVTRAAQNFTSNWESETTLTATFPTAMGGWLVWGDVLYKALTNITAGDTYVVNGNIEHFTIEDLYNAYLNTIANILAMVGDLADLTTSDTSDVVHAINSVLSDLNLTIGDLANLTTSDTSDIVNAINSVLSDLNLKIGDLANLTTSDTSDIVNAINSVLSDLNLTIGDLADLTTSDTSNVVNAINSVDTSLNTTITNLTAVSNLARQGRDLSSRKYILITDSYGYSPSISQNWQTYFESFVGTTCLKLAYAGQGFNVSGVNTILNSFSAETIADKDTYTDIIVCLGSNDAATNDLSTLGALLSHIGDFVNYCKTNYPNARISLGFIGYYLFTTVHAGTSTPLIYYNTVKTYQEAAAINGITYLSGVEYILHEFTLLAADGVHPTLLGAYRLAIGIFESYSAGAFKYFGSTSSLELTPVTGQVLDGQSTKQYYGRMEILDDNVMFNGTMFSWHSDTGVSIGTTWVKIADVGGTSLIGNGEDIIIPITTQALTTELGGDIYDMPMQLKFRDGELFIRQLFANSSSIVPLTFFTIFVYIPALSLPCMFN